MKFFAWGLTKWAEWAELAKIGVKCCGPNRVIYEAAI